MTTKEPPPITLSTTDLTQTRVPQTRTSMRWPSDPDTTTRLNRIIRLDLNSPVPWYGKLIRLLIRLRRGM